MNQTIRLRKLADQLTGFQGSDKDVTGPIGYLLGATYALIESSRLSYLYGEVNDADYAEELRSVATALANDKSVALISGQRLVSGIESSMPLNGSWLAGFYFNSALHRIAAGAERLGVHPNGEHKEPLAIKLSRCDVNKLKHLMKDKPQQKARGILTGREVKSIAIAINALETLVKVCILKGILKNSA